MLTFPLNIDEQISGLLPTPSLEPVWVWFFFNICMDIRTRVRVCMYIDTHVNADHHSSALLKDENVMLNPVNLFLMCPIEILSLHAVSKI